MLFGHTAVSASDDTFSIRDNPMNPGQKSTGRSRITKEDPAVIKTFCLDRFSVGSQSVASDPLQQALTLFTFDFTAKSVQKTLNVFGRNRLDHFHVRKTRALFPRFISIQRDSAQNTSLPLASPSVNRPSRAKKGIIHLHQSNQTIPSVTIRHRFSDFVSHKPGGFVIPDFQNPLHFSNRYTHFARCHVVNEPVPFKQRCSCLMENCAGGQTDLPTTPLTVKNPSCLNEPSFIRSTSRTDKPIRPSRLPKMLEARFLRCKSPLKFEQTSFPVLYCHQVPLPRQGTRSYELSQ